MLKTLMDFLFPGICCFCAAEQKGSTIDLCHNCKRSLPFIMDRCYRCGLRLEKAEEAIICEKCQNKPPPFSRLCALFSYESPVNKLITGLKFSSQLAYGRVLSDLLLEAVEKDWYKKAALPQVIIPMPLHKTRLRSRGYNQSLELVRSFQKQNKIPVLNNCCWRSRVTQMQSGLNAEHRRQNLKDAFQVQLPRSWSYEPLSHVAIIDDVVTTGSTVSALSLALKKAGIDQIDVWCICRA